jgi:hypothetical protein
MQGTPPLQHERLRHGDSGSWCRLVANVCLCCYMRACPCCACQMEAGARHGRQRQRCLSLDKVVVDVYRVAFAAGRVATAATRETDVMVWVMPGMHHACLAPGARSSDI